MCDVGSFLRTRNVSNTIYRICRGTIETQSGRTLGGLSKKGKVPLVHMRKRRHSSTPRLPDQL